jgi:hypothetical protein
LPASSFISPWFPRRAFGFAVPIATAA